MIEIKQLNQNKNYSKYIHYTYNICPDFEQLKVKIFPLAYVYEKTEDTFVYLFISILSFIDLPNFFEGPKNKQRNNNCTPALNAVN